MHYGVPYMWGPNVLMYNTEVFPEPPTYWSVVFEEQTLPVSQHLGEQAPAEGSGRSLEIGPPESVEYPKSEIPAGIDFGEDAALGAGPTDRLIENRPEHLIGRGNLAQHAPQGIEQRFRVRAGVRHHGNIRRRRPDRIFSSHP